MKLLNSQHPRARQNRMLLLMVLDVLSIYFAYAFALFLRFDFMYSHILADSVYHMDNFLRSMPIWCAVTLLVFFLFRLYHSIWRQASVAEIESIILAYLVLLPLYVLGLTLAHMLVEVANRYHYSVIPMLIIFAALALSRREKT